MSRLAGFKHSEETKGRISKNNACYWLGKCHSEETKRKISRKKKGTKMSSKTKKNMSEARKKEWDSGKRKGKAWSERAKKKLSLVLKGHIVSPKTRKKIGRANKGKLPWITGKHHSEETKRKLSKVNKGKKLKKEHIRKMLKRRKMSSLEVKVNNVIQKHSLPYKFVGNGKFFIERKNPDFVNINGEKVAVEVYCRKHKENVRGLNIDKWRENRSKLFAKYGWQTIFIEDWQTNKEETVLSLLKAIHE